MKIWALQYAAYKKGHDAEKMSAEYYVQRVDALIGCYLMSWCEVGAGCPASFFISHLVSLWDMHSAGRVLHEPRRAVSAPCRTW